MDQVHDMKRIINEYKETYRTVLFFSDENIESIKKAKSYKSLSHYTSIKSLKSILEAKKMKLTNIGKLSDKSERNSVGSEKYSAYIFPLSFTHKLESNEEMWKKFGDNYRGVKITYCFNNNIEELIDKDSLAEGMYEGTINSKFEFSGKNSNHYLSNDELLNKGLLVQLHYNDVDYINKEKLGFESSFKIKDEFWLDLYKFGKIKARYEYQEETRLTAVIMTNKKIKKINYLYVPLNLDKLREFRIEFGNKCKQEDIDEIENIIKKEHFKNIKLIK